MDQARIAELAEQAFAALESGDHVRALAIADQLAAFLPEDALVRVIRSQALLDAGNAEEALSEALRAVELADENDHAHLLLARAAWQSGRFALAQQSFVRAAALSGRKPGVLAEYAWFMACARGPRLGEQAALDALQADAGSSTAWAALGRAQHRLHRLADAQSSLQRALQLDPNNVCAQAATVMLLRAKGEDTKAMALADVMQDNPAAAGFVQSLQRDDQMRNLRKKLLDREDVRRALLAHTRDSTSWYWLPLVIGVVAVFVALCFLLMGDGRAAAAALTPLALLLLWRLYLLIGQRQG